MARRRRAVALASVIALSTACGGADDDSSGLNPFDALSQDGSDPSDGAGGDSDAGDAVDGAGNAGDENGTGGSPDVGPVTLEADSLSAWIEVDDERYEYLANGTVSFECAITSDNVRVNIQTPSEFFTLNGIVNEGVWLFTLNVLPPGDSDAGYGGSPLTSTGSVGLDDTSMSYEGDVSKVIGVDVANATMVPAKFAINCRPPGPDPSAEIGDAAFSAPFSSASSIVCVVSADDVDIRVQQQVTSRVQISIDATSDGTTWLGNAAVSADEGNYVSTMPSDGTGLIIEGQTVTYSGVFTTPTGESEGSVSVTCP